MRIDPAPALARVVRGIDAARPALPAVFGVGPARGCMCVRGGLCGRRLARGRESFDKPGERPDDQATTDDRRRLQRRSAKRRREDACAGRGVVADERLRPVVREPDDVAGHGRRAVLRVGTERLAPDDRRGTVRADPDPSELRSGDGVHRRRRGRPGQLRDERVGERVRLDRHLPRPARGDAVAPPAVDRVVLRRGDDHRPAGGAGDEERGTDEIEVHPVRQPCRMARRLDLQAGRELDQSLAEAGGLGVRRSGVRAAGERPRAAGEQARRCRVIREPAPAPGAAPTTPVERDRQPARDSPRGEVDAVDAARRSRLITVRRRRHVHRPCRERQCAPVELTVEVREDADRPARALRAGRECQRVQPAEAVHDIQRPRRRIDHSGRNDAVPVQLRTAVRELSKPVMPEHETAAVETDDISAGGRRDEDTAGDKHLGRDPPGQGHHEPPRDA